MHRCRGACSSNGQIRVLRPMVGLQVSGIQFPACSCPGSPGEPHEPQGQRCHLVSHPAPDLLQQPHLALMIRASQTLSLHRVNAQRTWSLGLWDPTGRLWFLAELLGRDGRGGGGVMGEPFAEHFICYFISSSWHCETGGIVLDSLQRREQRNSRSPNEWPGSLPWGFPFSH